MPAPSLRKLYIASSITELNQKVILDDSIKNTSSKKLLKAAEKVHESAEICYLQKDEEKAYIMYMKFMDLFLLLKKRKDFNEVIKSFKRLEKSLTPALERATELKTSLKQRYEVVKEAIDKEKEVSGLTTGDAQETKRNISDETTQVIDKTQSPMISDIILSDKSVQKDAIASEELYSILTNHSSSVIMMDVRPQKDFNESHVKHSRCISVPSEILEKGITGAKLERKLPLESLQKWQERSNADFIILIDWDGITPVDSESSMSALQDAMCKWELKNKLKNLPLILKGGYKDWMLRYPMYTTQVIPLADLESFTSTITTADLSDVQYPNFDEAFMESPKTPINQPDSSETNDSQHADKLFQPKVNGWVSDSSSLLPTNKSASAPPSVNRRIKPKPEPNLFLKHPEMNASQPQPSLIKKPENLHAEKSLPELVQNLKPAEADVNNVSIPAVNRRLKPLNVASKPEIELTDVSSHPPKDVLDMDEEKGVANENSDLAKLEKQFERLNMHKENSTEEKKMEIQKEIDALVILLRRAKIEKGEAIQNYSNTEIEKMKKKEEPEQRKVLEDIERNQLPSGSTEFKKMKIVPKIEKIHDDETGELEEKNSAGGKKTNISMSPKIDRPLVKDTEAKIGPKSQARRPTTGVEYTLALAKDGGKETFSRGLTRSHSFPNIAQMVDQEENESQRIKPTVDRSLKPRDQTTFIQTISTVRKRDFRPTYGCQARPITGIRNLGNTCFMNSIIQCLSNALPFAHYFTSEDYRQHINRNNRQGTKGEVAEEFAAVIQALWNGQYRSISPYDFLSTVGKYLPMCNGNEQQDSHEFLVVLMDKLHGDLKQKSDSRPMPSLESLPDQTAKATFWDYHKAQNRSKISELFDGLLKSTLRCMSCMNTSHSYEVFSCLSVPIPSSKSTSLINCIESFLKPERMSGEGAWDCPKCKQKKEAEKRMVICELPGILVVQLKRFSYEGLWRRKLQTSVDFPFKFEMPHEVNSKTILSKSYSLYGVVNHIGTLEGGHYTAYCKNYHSGKWYKYDDQEVSETSGSSIKTSEAYLLFYLSSDYDGLVK